VHVWSCAALGMNLALARVGSVLNNYVSLAVAEHFHVSTALWVGVGVCLVSLISTIWCFYIDRTAEHMVEANIKARDAGSGLPPMEKEVINLWAVKDFPVCPFPLSCSRADSCPSSMKMSAGSWS
jgi:hypothetical protein